MDHQHIPTAPVQHTVWLIRLGKVTSRETHHHWRLSKKFLKHVASESNTTPDCYAGVKVNDFHNNVGSLNCFFN